MIYSHLVRNMEVNLIAPVCKRIELDWSGVDRLVDQGHELHGLFITPVLTLLRPVNVLRHEKQVVDRDHFSLLVIVAEEKFLLQDWGIVNDSLPVARHSRLPEDLWHRQKVEDVLEKFCGVENGLDRCGRVADCVGGHDELWLFSSLYLDGLCCEESAALTGLFVSDAKVSVVRLRVDASNEDSCRSTRRCWVA